ncbi:hypothetical protein [Streptomyces prunicolor]
MVQADHASFLRSHGDPTESAEPTASVAHGDRAAGARLIEQALRGMTNAVGADHPLVRACEDALATGAEEPPDWDFEPQPI